jgi:transcriptional regulator of arginine metabolism
MKKYNDIDLKLIEIINNETCTEQEEIAGFLAGQGVNITQSSLSRRLKKLGIAKQEGVYQKLTTNFATGTLKHIDIAAPNMLVAHTLPGSAGALALQLDALLEHKQLKPRIRGILGTIAGDDTIFIAVDNKYSLKEQREKLLAYLTSV